MNYKCIECNDTGNKEKDMGGHLTCIACEAPAERMALKTFIEKLPAMGEQEQAWRVHQRALAMAPKQEAVKEYLSTQGEAPTIKENLIVPFAEAMSALNHVRTVAPMSYGRDPRDVLCAFINLVAAPAAANGALTDEQIMVAYDTQIAKGGSADSIIVRTCRAILAAAGPDAAPSPQTIIGMCKCKLCKGEGWVCENHADKPWTSDAGGCKCGAGAPCTCNSNADLPDGFTVLSGAKGN